MPRDIWTVDDENDNELFRGSKTAAYKFYKKHSRTARKSLSIGKLILENVNGRWIEPTLTPHLFSGVYKNEKGITIYAYTAQTILKQQKGLNKMQTTTLNERELAAILAGLRTIQRRGCEKQEVEIYCNGGKIAALKGNEIEKLCQKLNLGTFHPEACIFIRGREVTGTASNIPGFNVEILDFDTDDAKELKRMERREKQVKKSMKYWG